MAGKPGSGRHLQSERHGLRNPPGRHTPLTMRNLTETAWAPSARGKEGEGKGDRRPTSAGAPGMAATGCARRAVAALTNAHVTSRQAQRSWAIVGRSALLIATTKCSSPRTNCCEWGADHVTRRELDMHVTTKEWFHSVASGGRAAAVGPQQVAHRTEHVAAQFSHNEGSPNLHARDLATLAAAPSVPWATLAPPHVDMARSHFLSNTLHLSHTSVDRVHPWPRAETAPPCWT